ncbi:putative protein isoform X2 [Gossypium australe]|uniref:Uncharacterized protein n=1 Tax=Gossypium australe TaxID=47621 RepID=A0A5B6UY50_9ROSI|nr:putative protein isoform X2 [Gossypium australe]
MQEESQRQNVSSPIVVDPTSLYSANVNPHKKRFNGVCDHCKVKGHKREIGYTLHFKFTKKYFMLGTGGNNVVADEGIVADSSVPNNNIQSMSTSCECILDTSATNHMLSSFQHLEFPVACASNSPCVRPLKWHDEGDW